jgi:hypothetical protein
MTEGEGGGHQGRRTWLKQGSSHHTTSDSSRSTRASSVAGPEPKAFNKGGVRHTVQCIAAGRAAAQGPRRWRQPTPHGWSTTRPTKKEAWGCQHNPTPTLTCKPLTGALQHEASACTMRRKVGEAGMSGPA